MSAVRPGAPGATRVCPHCKATVLESATICPGCRHHLRFKTGSPGSPESESAEVYCALNVEGTLKHQVVGEACEYCVVLEIRNQAGQTITRHVTGVGALQPGERRHLSLSVDLIPVSARTARPSQHSGATPGQGPGSTTAAASATRPPAGAAPAGSLAAAPEKPGAAPGGAPGTGAATKPATTSSAGQTSARPAQAAKPGQPAKPAQPAQPATSTRRPGLPLQGTRIRVFRRR